MIGTIITALVGYGIAIMCTALMALTLVIAFLTLSNQSIDGTVRAAVLFRQTTILAVLAVAISAATHWLTGV